MRIVQAKTKCEGHVIWRTLLKQPWCLLCPRNKSPSSSTLQSWLYCSSKNTTEMLFPKSFIVAYGSTLLPFLLSGASPIVPRYFQRNLLTRHNISASTVATELAPQLSDGSLVFGPDNSLWANATWRWNTLVNPDVQVIVQPAAESDIAKIVSSHSGAPFRFDGSLANAMQHRSNTVLATASSSS